MQLCAILASYPRGLDVCEKATNPEVSVEHDKRYFMMRGHGNVNVKYQIILSPIPTLISPTVVNSVRVDFLYLIEKDLRFFSMGALGFFHSALVSPQSHYQLFTLHNFIP